MILKEELYKMIVGRKQSIEDSMSLLYWIIRFTLKAKKEKRDIKLADIPREMWRTLVISGQTNFPPKVFKLFSETKVQNVIVTEFRLSNETAVSLYGAKHIHILSRFDLLA